MQKDNQFSKVLKIDAERHAPCAMRHALRAASLTLTKTDNGKRRTVNDG